MTVDLTQEEINTLHGLLKCVGGHPEHSRRKHIITVKNKLKRFRSYDWFNNEGAVPRGSVFFKAVN